MDLLKNFFKNMIKDQASKVDDENFTSIMDRIRKLTAKNILDFSVISELTKLIKSKDELCPYFQIWVKEMTNVMKEVFKKFQSESSLEAYCNLINISLNFMLVIYNLRQYRGFIEIVFEKNSRVVKLIIEIIEGANKYEQAKRIPKIFCNIFLDEFKEVFFSHNLDELFILNNEKFTKVNTEGIDVYPKVIYSNLLEFLTKFDLTYKVVFASKKYKDEEKPLIKTMLIQSILRVVFSREKTKFVSTQQYEIQFLRNIVRRSLEYYKNKYGAKINSLFREDEIFDDMIKYLLILNGNTLFFRTMISNLNLIFPPDGSVNLDEISFNLFFECFIEGITLYLPGIIKIMLKIMYELVTQMFPEESNYSPLFTYLIFNFLCSPRFQDMFGINLSTNKVVKDINLLIKNIYFGKEFGENDPLAKFNGTILFNHIRLNKLMENILSKVDEEFIKTFDSCYITTQPNFLYYFDTSFILGIIKRIEGFNLHSMLVEVTPSLSIEKD